MKRFMDLYISLPREKFEAFVSDYSKNLPREWTRDKEKESLIPTISDKKMYCFSRNKKDGLDSALWLAEKDLETLYISNIVPSELRELKIDNYNKVLVEFFSYSLKDCVKGLGGSVELTSDMYSLEDILGVEAARSLRLFSSAANKSTGIAHPADRKRWFEFITLIHESKTINSEEVEKFLIEDGWSEDLAFELAIKFEYSQDLLKFYEGE